MTRYYDIKIHTKNKNIFASYLADAFSINEDRILKIKSREFGDLVVQIEPNEEVTVQEIELKDDWEYLF